MTTPIPDFAHALVTRDERGVYTLQIHNAKSLNILSLDVMRGMTEAAVWLAQQDDARAVILRGTGEKAFVGGANIYQMAELEPQSAREFITTLRNLCEAVAAIPVPTVARLAGFCLGAGMELAAVCDIRLASDDAIFGMPEVRVGIPSVIHAVLFPRLIGQGPTNWLLLTGETVDAEQASCWGFVEFVSKPEALDAAIQRTVGAIAASGPVAVKAQKGLLRYWTESSIEAGLDRSVDVFGDAFLTDEPKRYMAPFLAKKKGAEKH
ncbi:enoyl-CoA hydratase [Bordetella sp. N]|uniref:enoyl-CoA hydratase n=1 Tax=Bordetella sp. N TaxID=1746199 RepID=UPI000709B353|nr:enoyl-CoA hydratase [Bordetella sp. N]ALM86623.1 enoyl-CoA hydratase [Bordetella sp. N]